MILQTKPNNRKLLRSATISSGAVAVVLLLQYLFPDFDLSGFEAAVLTGVSAWVVNLVRETNG